jgi:hypothetical protein
MKKLFFLLAIATTFSAQAQFALGPEVGFNSATISGGANKFTSHTGARLGFTADIQLSGDLYLQPGLFYSSKGGYTITESTQDLAQLANLGSLSTLLGAGLGNSLSSLTTVTVTSNTAYTLNYLHLPVLAMYKIKTGDNGKILVGVGPYVSMLMNGRYKRSSVTSVLGMNITTNEDRALMKDTEISGIDFGLNCNLGYEHNSGFFFRTFYEMAITDNTIGKNTGFGISLGYYFRGANAAN